MKHLIKSLLLGLIILTLLSSCFVYAEKKAEKKTITLSGAWAIYPTAVAWSKEFRKTHKDIKIEISAGGAGKGAADTISGLVDIGMVSRDPDPAEIAKGISPVYILHDAVFPVMNANSPQAAAVMKRGIKLAEWQNLYLQGTQVSWSTFGGSKNPVSVYTRSDSCGAAAAWAKYLGNKKQENLKGIGVYGDPGILVAVKKDPAGVGYSNFSYVFNRKGKILDGILLVPIDVNNNGKADSNEILTDRASAIAAIENGSYPVVRQSYFFVKGKPQGIVKEFILFALSEKGTAIVNKVGTSLPISATDRAKVIQQLQ
ncbi:MAG: substrate-binding domain-containing protein [Candidatus Margulisbacteria bacterium]|nr:substrate-binding domain-containing protein [Candidatus Margulisiibacteriota bacterium]